MLKIKNLHVSIKGREILKGISLKIESGQTFILFGPNGSGKTTLLMSLMGIGNYTITKGRIIFMDEDITYASIYKRARMGLGMSFQRPPTIRGLKTRQLVRMAAHGRDTNVEYMARKMNLENFLDRDINSGFSGGEIKRSELLQLMAQQAKLVLFDEPESGVDLENMVLIGSTVRALLDGSLLPQPELSIKCQKNEHNAAGLIITHTGYILDYVNADRGQVLYNGYLCCEARPLDILDHIRQYGYKECIRCLQ
ncbi:Fe-S cluster assembly ATP-binding protein [Desulfovibrionales bacterium]